MLWYFYILLIIGSVVIGMIRRRHLSLSIRVILALVIIALSVELAKKFLDDKQVYLIEHVYMRIELIFWFGYYYLILAKNKRIILYSGLVFFTAIMYGMKLFLQIESWGTNYYDYVMLAVCVSIWTIVFLSEIMYKPMDYSLKRDGNFWINCGNSLFYPGLVFAFGFRYTFENTAPVIDQLLTGMVRALNLLIYAFYGVAFYLEQNLKYEAGQKSLESLNK